MDRYSKSALMDVMLWGVKGGFKVKMVQADFGEIVVNLEDNQGVKIEVETDGLEIVVYDSKTWGHLNGMRSYNDSLLADCQKIYAEFKQTLRKEAAKNGKNQH